MCAYPECNNPSEFHLGVAKYNQNKIEQMIGPVCDEHMRPAIENIMKQCFGTMLWAVVCDKTGKILYHSYEADQEGIKAAYGWEYYKEEVLKQ